MRLKLFASICLCAAGIAACGGSSNSSSSTTAAASGATGPTAAQIQARVNLAKCLRGHGIDVPDVVGSGGPAARAALQQLVAQYGLNALVQKAQSYCKENLVTAFPVFSLSAAQLAQRRQQALKFVECLRAHGVSGIPDPSGTGIAAGLGRALSTIDTNSPVFQSAQKACQSLAPTPVR
jgi:hypothetical protein